MTEGSDIDFLFDSTPESVYKHRLAYLAHPKTFSPKSTRLTAVNHSFFNPRPAGLRSGFRSFQIRLDVIGEQHTMVKSSKAETSPHLFPPRRLPSSKISMKLRCLATRIATNLLIRPILVMRHISAMPFPSQQLHMHEIWHAILHPFDGLKLQGSQRE